MSGDLSRVMGYKCSDPLCHTTLLRKLSGAEVSMTSKLYIWTAVKCITLEPMVKWTLDLCVMPYEEDSDKLITWRVDEDTHLSLTVSIIDTICIYYLPHAHRNLEILE